MGSPSLFSHLKAVLLLPFMVIVIVPYSIIPIGRALITGNWLLKLAGVLLFITGLSLFLWTVWLFGKVGKGTLAPWEPTQQMVVVGPYRYCRNPMITGILFILLGEGLFFNSVSMLGWALLFVMINTTYFILKEEPDLMKRFGKEYEAYKKNVPRWIPTLSTYKK